MLKLYIGNKNYSSWSLRPWVLMTQAGIAFDEIKLRFDDMGPESRFRREVARINPAGRVPVLVDDGFAVWDTLAIAEYLAEKFPEKALWPQDARSRGRARSVCAEMHAGFAHLREHCPMNLEATLPEVGARVLASQAGLRADLDRIVAMWSECLRASGGPMLFGAFSIADAYFAPVATRIRTYALPVPSAIDAYVERIFALPAMQAWVREALAEHDYVAVDEPYRKPA